MDGEYMSDENTIYNDLMLDCVAEPLSTDEADMEETTLQSVWLIDDGTDKAVDLISNPCEERSGALCAACGLFRCPHIQQEPDIISHAATSDMAFCQDHSYSCLSSCKLHKRTGQPLTRKRTRDESRWQSSTRKRRRQSGMSYRTAAGKIAEAKTVGQCKRDHTACRFRCSVSFSSDDQQKIHSEHWGLSDDKKREFYVRTTTVKGKARTRRAFDKTKKKMSYSFFFMKGKEKIRICKDFYLSTLSIDAKRIVNTHKSKNSTTGTAALYCRGKHVKKTCKNYRPGIRAHIESIPKIESHYCRQNTNKEYFSGNLNMQILYEQYVAQCEASDTQPAKKHLYREVFNTEYNIEFNKPKKDRCDICEAGKLGNCEPGKLNAHLKSKGETHEERMKDRNNKLSCVLCFDMQNVFALPQANVSNFFYKRKLNVYHLTGHCSLTSQSYGVLWPETLTGRTGNDIASSVVLLLNKLLTDNTVEHITLWSDSCIPQNRNKVLSTALMLLIESSEHLKSIVQKFGEPGHSEVQEVDNLHSQIDRVMQHAEVYSPVGLVRILKNVPRGKPIKLVQMKACDVKDFHEEAELFDFECIPFSKVKSIRYSSTAPMTLEYKTCFAEAWQAQVIKPKARTRSSASCIETVVFKKPKQSAKAQLNHISAEKAKDIASMLKFMPEQDRLYMSIICRAFDCSQASASTSGETSEPCRGTQSGRMETGNKAGSTTVKACKKTSAAAVAADTGKITVAPAAETRKKRETRKKTPRAAVAVETGKLVVAPAAETRKKRETRKKTYF